MTMTKIVYGLKQPLTLVRKPDADAIFRAHAASAGKVDISKISWLMPHNIPVDIGKMNLDKTIKSKATLPVAFRARQCDTIMVPQSTTFSWRLSVKTSPEKPRYILVAFQTNRAGNQESNTSIFDHCNLKICTL